MLLLVLYLLCEQTGGAEERDIVLLLVLLFEALDSYTRTPNNQRWLFQSDIGIGDGLTSKTILELIPNLQYKLTDITDLEPAN